MDIELDKPLRIDQYAMVGPGYPLTYQGVDLRLTPGEATVVWSLMKAYPAHVSRWTLLERLGAEEATGNLIQVLVCRIRKKMSQAGAAPSIETVSRRGYRWIAGGGHELARQIAQGDGPISEILAQLYSIDGRAADHA